MTGFVATAPRTVEVASAQVFASGATGTNALTDAGNADELHLIVECTAVAGTSPTLDAKLQTS